MAAEREGTFFILRQMEGYSFTEAVSHLADKYQIDLPEQVAAVSAYSTGSSDEQKWRKLMIC
ncbi:hypothetical protein PO124_17290 [Bacillus licheniformis]|nr:hypothetical protein [Bacillus licheniformis]